MSELKTRVHRFVTNDFTARASFVDASQVVQHMRSIQNTSPVATEGIGTLMVASLLMASNLRNNQKVGIYARGSGLLIGLYAEAQFEGQVRGYTPVPQIILGQTLSEALGKGTLSVTRHQPFQKEPFHGTIERTDQGLKQDIVYYLHQSQQIRSVFECRVILDSSNNVQFAGGFLVEVMPGVDQSVFDTIQKNIQEEFLQTYQQDRNLSGIMAKVFSGFPFTELDHDYNVIYDCPCDETRVLTAMEMFGPEGLQEMIDEGKAAEVTCQMCGKPYTIDVESLKKMKDRIFRQGMN